MQKFAFFGIKYRPRYPDTPSANDLVECQKKHFGGFIGNTTQQNKIHWSDQAKSYTFAHNIQTLIRSQFSTYEKVFTEKPGVPFEFHLEITRDQNSICTS